MFSEIQVKGAYEDLYDCSYLKATYDMNNGSDVIVYGWIDSVECSSDTTGSPMTKIHWHIDYWRTYLSQATFKNGMVVRRPLKNNDVLPPQNYPRRNYSSELVQKVIPDTNVWWVVFTFTSNDKIPVLGGTITLTCTATFPVNISSPGVSFNVSGTDMHGTETVTKTTPPLNHVVAGWFDELLGLDPNAMSSCFLSPIPPDDFGGSMTKSASGWNVWSSSSDLYKDFGCLVKINYKATYQQTVSISAMTDDVNTYAITGFNGETIGVLPWGLAVTAFQSRLIIDAASSYIEIRANGITGTSMGQTFNIPLIPITVTSNSMSSYVYSGARDADNANRRDQLLMSAFGGLSNVGKAIGENAIAPVAASVGTATLGVVGVAGVAANFGIGALSNAMAQQAKTRSVASQTQHFVMSGTGWDVITYGRMPALIKMVMDEYSQTQRTNDIAIYGANVAEPMSSCQTLINAGGPLKIEDLCVTGGIPVEAKQYFKNIFARGVRIV